MLGLVISFIYVFQQVLGNDIAVYRVRSNEVRHFFFNIFVTSKKDKLLTFAKKSCRQAKLITKK
jgi:hypothetical protein